MNHQRDQQLKKIRKFGLDSNLIIENKNLCGVSSRFFLDEKSEKKRRAWIGFLLDYKTYKSVLSVKWLLS